MILRIIIATLLIFTGALFPADDSHTAIMAYLQSIKPAESTKSLEIKPIKSLLIHPHQRGKLLGKAQYSRPNLDNEQLYRSSAGNFLFHYTETGYDAVDPLSTNADGVPDYIYEAALAAEYAYRILVDTLGFDPPPVDDSATPETDIYVMNLGGSAYAYTYNENEVVSTSRSDDWTAYTTIDNDYSEMGYHTRGLNGMRVTIAHEYFHVVQLGYNWYWENDLPGSNGDTYFLEWSSTWFEERAYPEINDYVQYVNGFFANPTRSIWHSSYAYALGPFIAYLIDIYGDERLIQKVWEKIKSQYALQALMDVISEYGGDLANQYNSFMAACYYTGARYNELYAVSPDARLFPEMVLTKRSFVDSLLIEGAVNPLATAPYAVSFTTNQFLNLEVKSPVSGEFKGSYLIDQYSAGDFFRKFADQTEVFVGETRRSDQLALFVTNTSIEQSRDLHLELTITETFPTKILELWANPYSSQRHASLKFNLQLGKFIDKLQLQIYNLLGQQVYSRIIDGENLNPGILLLEIRSAELQIRNISSGIYFLRLLADDSEVVRKFTIIN
ncbi:MAG TPA: T9SS type A sorting domain-containing protein [Candidatus Marinimicrobia bacterium]|nr:T9SS type A sorting domain-containing protein [Candidatus Neomarinimicrobiota bacterium]